MAVLIKSNPRGTEMTRRVSLLKPMKKKLMNSIRTVLVAEGTLSELISM
jgi:hypothetical protein